MSENSIYTSLHYMAPSRSFSASKHWGYLATTLLQLQGENKSGRSSVHRWQISFSWMLVFYPILSNMHRFSSRWLNLEGFPTTCGPSRKKQCPEVKNPSPSDRAEIFSKTTPSAVQLLSDTVSNWISEPWAQKDMTDPSRSRRVTFATLRMWAEEINQQLQALLLYLVTISMTKRSSLPLYYLITLDCGSNVFSAVIDGWRGKSRVTYLTAKLFFRRVLNFLSPFCPLKCTNSPSRLYLLLHRQLILQLPMVFCRDQYCGSAGGSSHSVSWWEFGQLAAVVSNPSLVYH